MTDKLLKLVQDAYDEGVEDGIGWHSYPESGPRPEWIDSVARTNILAARIGANYREMHGLPETAPLTEIVALERIAVMMGEFVDNWPRPKRFETALALIAKTLRHTLGVEPRHCQVPDCVVCEALDKAGVQQPRDEQWFAKLAAASADTHPTGGDSTEIEAPASLSGAVPEGQTPSPSPSPAAGR